MSTKNTNVMITQKFICFCIVSKNEIDIIVSINKIAIVS
jgi:hypothetical protein